jgi:hypothetical protein
MLYLMPDAIYPSTLLTAAVLTAVFSSWLLHLMNPLAVLAAAAVADGSQADRQLIRLTPGFTPTVENG